jgi:hypothetical protein
MNVAGFYHAIGTAVCIAISYGLNHVQRPAYEPDYAAQVYTDERGTLQLNYHGQTLSYPLMLSHVIARDVQRVGRAYQLRELSLRAAAPRAQQAKIELYIDVSQRTNGLSAGAGDPQIFAAQELAVSRNGRFGTRPSYIVSDDGQTHNVVTGNIMLTEVVPTESDGPPRYRSEGRLELQIESATGVELITGRFEGQIAWDASP